MAWNQSSNAPRAKVHTRPKALYWLVAFAIAATVAIVILAVSSREIPVDNDTVVTSGAIPDVDPSHLASLKATRGNNDARPEKAKKEIPPFEKRPGALQLPDGQVLTFPAPKEGETRKVYAYGHMYECDHLGNFRDITPRKLFKTAFEGNFLALAQEGKPFIPAFLTGLDEEAVRKMLTKPYEPIGDETDDEKAQLKAYDEMRAAALDYMDQGGSFDDFVNDIAKFEKKQREAQAMCLREVMTLVKEGKVAEAKEMLRAADILTAKEGYQPIRIPPYVLDAFNQLP